MKEVAEIRVNRSEIISVSQIRKSRTAALASKEELAPWLRKSSFKDPLSQNIMRKASRCVAEKNGASSLVTSYWCTPRKAALIWGNKKRAEIEQHLPNSLKWKVLRKIWIINDVNDVNFEQVHHEQDDKQDRSHMLRGLHRESCSGYARQTRRWRDVLGAVPGEGHVMPPHFFVSVETVTLTRACMSWRSSKQFIERITWGSPYLFQQRSAHAHAARKTQSRREGNLQMAWSQYFVPLNSPDLNPMDNFVWSVAESKANEHRVASRDAPKRKITEVSEIIAKERVARACALRVLPDPSQECPQCGGRSRLMGDWECMP